MNDCHRFASRPGTPGGSISGGSGYSRDETLLREAIAAIAAPTKPLTRFHMHRTIEVMAREQTDPIGRREQANPLLQRINFFATRPHRHSADMKLRYDVDAFVNAVLNSESRRAAAVVQRVIWKSGSKPAVGTAQGRGIG